MATINESATTRADLLDHVVRTRTTTTRGQHQRRGQRLTILLHRCATRLREVLPAGAFGIGRIHVHRGAGTVPDGELVPEVAFDVEVALCLIGSHSTQP